MLAARAASHRRFAPYQTALSAVGGCRECRPVRGVISLNCLRELSTRPKGTIPPTNKTDERPQLEREQWMIQKDALKIKFGEGGWQPRKRLSPDAIEGIRSLHAQDPETYSTPYLANHFQVSPEAIRRILKSKWRPSATEDLKRRERWERRGQSVWSRWAELGFDPPKKWKAGMDADDQKSTISETHIAKTQARRSNASSRGDSSLSNRIL